MKYKIHLPKKYVMAGVPAGSVDNKGVSNEKKAIWLEYGIPEKYIPARPFMTRTLYHIPENVRSLVWTNPKKAGEMILSIMKNQMNQPDYTPLNKKTIKSRLRHGNSSAQPTIDTGQLRDSLISEYGVENG